MAANLVSISATPGAAPTLIIDDAFEDKLLACMFRLPECMSPAAAYLKPSYFGSPMRRNLAKMAIDFWQNYTAIIRNVSLVHELKALVNKKIIQKHEALIYGNYVLSLGKQDISDHQWVMHKLVEFIKHQELRTLVNDSVSKYLPRGEYEKIEKAFFDVIAVNAVPSPQPYAYMNPKNIEARLTARERIATSGKTGIPTGIPEMDRTLPMGGWNAKELYVIMAGPKRGKTMSLLWFACFAAQRGFNAMFFTLETAVTVLSDRLDAMNTQVETKMLTDKRTHVFNTLQGKKWDADVFFMEYPSGVCTVSEIESEVSKFERESGKIIDIIFVDYGDLCRPQRRMDDRWQEQAEIFKELRGMAGKFGVPVISATQVGKLGTGKQVNYGTDVSGSFEKIMVADSIISLSANNDELARGELRVTFAESRNNERKSFLIKTNYGAGTFFKEFIKVE